MGLVVLYKNAFIYKKCLYTKHNFIKIALYAKKCTTNIFLYTCFIYIYIYVYQKCLMYKNMFYMQKIIVLTIKIKNHIQKYLILYKKNNFHIQKMYYITKKC